MVHKILIIGLSIALVACSNNATQDIETPKKKADFAMVLHGGAGTILKENMSPEKEKAYIEALNSALDIGSKILSQGGSSMDAVTQTIIHLEDSPLFNAGKGAVFTNEGTNEMDASIMKGDDLEAGAVGGIKTIKNPILAARAVLEKSEHVFMSGAGADRFAQQQGLETAVPEYFRTERRWESLQKILEKEKVIGLSEETILDSKFGTVGVVALDKSGNIVAGTSTGGMTNKKYNRIGDSPVIGAGTYASNSSCGVSCTGHGEYFIRYAVAHDVSAMMEYKGVDLKVAAEYIINEKLKKAGGSGGLVALDRYGNISMPFNTPGMYRAYVRGKERYIGIYKEDL